MPTGGKLAAANMTIIPSSNPISFAFYPIVLSSIRIFGKRIVEFMSSLVKKNDGVKDYDGDHLVGHSLGAHVSGTAGGQVTRNSDQ